MRSKTFKGFAWRLGDLYTRPDGAGGFLYSSFVNMAALYQTIDRAIAALQDRNSSMLEGGCVDAVKRKPHFELVSVFEITEDTLTLVAEDTI